MATEQTRQLMSEAEQAFQAGDLERALSRAQAALRSASLLGSTLGPQEFSIRHFIATCHERAGDPQSALRIHKDNAQRGSPLEATYERLAFLGERHGDLEAVRTGTLWLREFAARFGLVDVKAERRLQRVEKRARQGRAAEPSSATAAGGHPRPEPAGCALLALAALCAAGACLAFGWASRGL